MRWLPFLYKRRVKLYNLAYMKPNIIGVVGYGYVGKAMVEFFRTHYQVFIYDPEYVMQCPALDNAYFVESIEKLNSMNCDVTAVCVPTPMGEDGSCDTHLVEETVKNIDARVILIKSTIPPGTTDRLIKETGKRIVFSPEFAGESKYWSPYKFDKDMKEMPYVILGGESGDTAKVVDIFIKILGPKKNYWQTEAKVAEMVKYMENVFFATKVTFVNEMFEICEAVGVDYRKVRELWIQDPRVEPMHTAVFVDARGYGGKCFPKDVSALVSFSEKAGYKPELISEVMKSNVRFRKMNDDAKNK